MKIICIGRNYAEHAKEMNSPVPTEPVIFLKPDTAILKDNQPFYIPSFSNEIHHEVEIVLRIDKLGKYIEPEFAHKYYDAIGLGIDFTARDIQAKCKEKGLPWEKAKAFDNAAPVSAFFPKQEFGDLSNLQFRLDINGKTRQAGSTKDLIFSFDHLVSYVSKFFTLKTGDLIFTGTPEGVGPVAPGDRLQAYIGERKMMDFEIR